MEHHLLDERLRSGDSSAGGTLAASTDYGATAAADAPSPLAAARFAPGNIRSLILEKEKELHDINEYRIRTLEALLRNKETAANSYKQKFAKLQEDFKYNLKARLLEGRDEELALYDTNFATLKAALRDRESDISELKAHLAETQSELLQSQTRSRKLELHCQQQLKDARKQVDAVRSQCDDEVRRYQADCAEQLRNSERRVRDQQNELETQRRELSVTFDELLSTREREFRQTLDVAESTSRELTLELKATSRDRDGLRDRLVDAQSKAENLATLLGESEKALKAAEYELADVRAVNASKVEALERDVAALERIKQALLDEYEGKMAELLESLHAVEHAFVKQKQQFDNELAHHMHCKDTEREQHTLRLDAKIASLTTKVRELDDALDDARSELKQAKWTSDDALLAKDREVAHAQSDLQDAADERAALVSGYKQQLAQRERDALAAHDKLAAATAQLESQRETEQALRLELIESKEQLDAAKRDAVALDQRWETMWADREQTLMARHDLQMRELEAAKQRLVADKQATDEQLTHAEHELQQLRTELYALRTDARIAASFGAQYHSNASGDASRSAEVSGRAAPSPLWSDDNGELSPIAGMSPLLTDTPPKRASRRAAERVSDAVGGSAAGSAATNNSLEALQLENAKLRDLIHEMRNALTQQASDSPATPQQSDALASELRESQRRCVLLEAQLVQLQAAAAAAVAVDNTDTTTQQQALAAARCTIEQQAARIVELETQLQAAHDAAISAPLGADRVLAEAHVSDLKQQLATATSDLERLVHERSQLMELSNQLRAELRALRDSSSRNSNDAGAGTGTGSSSGADTKDLEHLVAELSRSLDESRLHNRTLKKELRRVLKQQQQQQQQQHGMTDATADRRDVRRRDASVASTAVATDVTSADGRRRSSTLSMMHALDEPTPSPLRATGSGNGDLDADLLSLARSKRPSDADRTASPFRSERHRSSTAAAPAGGRDDTTTASQRRGRSASTTSRPRSIRERDDEADDDAASKSSENGDVAAYRSSRRESREDIAAPLSLTRSRRDRTASSTSLDSTSNTVTITATATATGPKTALSSLFQRERLDAVASAADANSTAKVSDARLRLQQDIHSLELLQLAGRKAERNASLSTFATARSTSDRATPSQKSAIKKLKDLQSRRAEMVADRKRVRNYSVAT